MRYLIVNADDFGFSPQVTQGVIEAFQRGVVTDTTVLIHSPYAEQALRQAAAVGLPVGVHIDFVTEYSFNHNPLKAELIGPNGQFTRELFQREFNNHIEHSYTCHELFALRDEIRTQVYQFMRLTGDKPSHLDYHFGLHHIPEVMAIYITVAEEFRVPVRWGKQYAGKNPYAYSPQLLCDVFRGTPQTCLDDFIGLIEGPWDGVMEICCHPGYTTPEGLPDPYNREREYELAVLGDARLRQEIESRDIQLVNYHYFANLLNDGATIGGKLS